MLELLCLGFIHLVICNCAVLGVGNCICMSALDPATYIGAALGVGDCICVLALDPVASMVGPMLYSPTDTEIGRLATACVSVVA